MVRKSDLARASMFVAISIVAVMADADPQKTMKLREATTKAEATLCGDLKALKMAMAPIDTMTPDTKVEALREVRTSADKEIKDVRKAVKDLEDAKLKELENAFESFKKAAQKIPGTTTVGAAAPTLSEEVKNVQVARERYNAPLNCQMEGSIGPDKKKK